MTPEPRLAARDRAMARAYALGVDSVVLARIAGRSPHHVRLRLRLCGVALRSRAEVNRSRARSKVDPERVRALAALGWSARAIARELQVHRNTILRSLRRQGLPVGMPANRSGPDNPAWNDGRTVTADGYVRLLLPGHPRADSRGYVLEHVVAAEESLGRSLRPGEVVHHRNGDRQDNAPGNLVVYASQADHVAATMRGGRTVVEVAPDWLEEAVVAGGER